MNVKSSTLDQ